MVGNATQTSKKAKKSQESPAKEPATEEREDGDKRSSNPQTPKQSK